MAVAVPDFGSLAQQQQAQNDDATRRTTWSQRPDQHGPLGDVTWNQDPSGRWFATNTLNAPANNLLNSTLGWQQGLGSQLGAGAPQASFGAQQNVIDAWNALQQPGLDKAGAAARNRAAAMGITLGSTASNDIERTIGTNEATSRNQGILQGVNAYSDMYKNQLAGYNASKDAMTAMTGVRDSLNPNKWQLEVKPGASYTPLNLYGAAGDTFAAGIQNENIDVAKRQQNIQGATNLLGGLGGGAGSFLGGALGGAGSALGSIGSGLWNGATSAWDWASNMYRTGGASGNNNYIMPEDWEAQNY